MSLADPEIGIVGAGAWGTAIAMLANRAGSRVTLHVRNPQVYRTLLEDRVNAAYLPDFLVDPSIRVTDELADMQGCEMLILAVPSQSLRTVAITLSDLVSASTPLLIASKGFEQGSLMLMSEVVQSILPHNPLGILTGPNFAHEAARGLPTASVIATYHPALAERAIYALASGYYRLYASDDPIAAQIGGAVKNVIAIASGIASARGLGENARAALLTRGLAEMQRLARAKGGREETLSGLSGMGDLILTASSASSRNFAFGMRLGQGTAPQDILRRGVLVEGAVAAESTCLLASKLGVRLPICESVRGVVSGNLSIEDALGGLMGRAYGKE